MTGSKSSTMGRSVSAFVLALHLVVFVLGGALLGRAPARADDAGRLRALVTATTGTGEGPAAFSQSDGRLESGTRPRADRGARGASGAPLHVTLPSGPPSVGPAAFAGLIEWRTPSRADRPPPSIVYAARGPPPAS